MAHVHFYNLNGDVPFVLISVFFSSCIFWVSNQHKLYFKIYREKKPTVIRKISSRNHTSVWFCANVCKVPRNIIISEKEREEKTLVLALFEDSNAGPWLKKPMKIRWMLIWSNKLLTEITSRLQPKIPHFLLLLFRRHLCIYMWNCRQIHFFLPFHWWFNCWINLS